MDDCKSFHEVISWDGIAGNYFSFPGSILQKFQIK